MCNCGNVGDTSSGIHAHDDLYYPKERVYTRAEVDAMLADVASPHLIGEIRAYVGDTVPAGWLECNAQIVDVDDYPDLFAVIGHKFDQVALVDQFQIPPPARVLVGRADGLTEFNTVGKQGGVMYHTLSVAEMPTHRHNWTARSGTVATGVTYTNLAGTGNRMVSGGTGGSEVVQNPLINEEGGGLAHNNLQPYVVVTMIIRALP